MERREFLRWIGLTAIASQISLPTFSEVESEVETRNASVKNTQEPEDPFWHIRKLMKERALPEWEYYFIATGAPTFAESNATPKYDKEYTVFLLQNGNHHRESFRTFAGISEFNERNQEYMFRRLMNGVDQFNTLTKGKQEEIIAMMDKIRRGL